ncbi:MAG: thioredoxin family protein [Candidatus Eisenbacteria bacterium]|nr:thioredoxin family protein [Candidatus Eisenbacteria bacterium]
MQKIQILGTGCPKCEQLARNAAEAIRELGLDCEVEKVSRIEEIAAFGVMLTPALAIDGDVKLVGKVASVEELKELLQ